MIAFVLSLPSTPHKQISQLSSAALLLLLFLAGFPLKVYHAKRDARVFPVEIHWASETRTIAYRPAACRRPSRSRRKRERRAAWFSSGARHAGTRFFFGLFNRRFELKVKTRGTRFGLSCLNGKQQNWKPPGGIAPQL